MKNNAMKSKNIKNKIMKNQFNNTFNKIISIFMIILMVSLTPVFALSISGTNADVSDRYAVIKWDTDEMSTSRVAYGLNESSMDKRQTDSTPATNHTIVLLGLQRSTTYSYSANSTNQNGTATSGVLEFTTSAVDDKNPFVEFDVPEYTRDARLNIEGLTEPDSEVYLYFNLDPVNPDYSTPVRFASNVSDGRFSFLGVILPRQGSNTVTISSVDPSGHRTEITKTVVLDQSPPLITYDKPIPEAIGEPSYVLKGNVNEAADIEVTLQEPKTGKVSFTQIINTTGNFEVTIPFGADGDYKLTVYAIDRAGNPRENVYTIMLDSREMFIENLNLKDLNPSYVLHRTVRGTTKPGATVVVYVNNKTTNDARTALGLLKAATQIGIPGIGPETQFETVARGERLSYMQTAAADGRFAIEIELEQTIRTTDIVAQQYGVEIGDIWANDVTVVASDKVGRIQKESETIYYGRCGLGGYFAIGSPVPSPSSIPEPILRAGFGQVGLAMSLKWNGPTAKEQVRITNVQITEQQISNEDRFGQYNLTMGKNKMYKGAILSPALPGVEDTQLYALITLNAPDANYKFSADSMVKDELKFPLMIEMEYTYEKPGGGRSEKIVQKKCIPIHISVEPALTTIVNPRGTLRYLTANLDGTVRTIDAMLEKIKTAQKGALYTCAAGIVINVFKTIITKYRCWGVTGGDIRNELKGSNEEKGHCTVNYVGDKLKCECDQGGHLGCCESTVALLNFQKNTMNSVCDRIFCPSVPSLAKHVASYQDLITLRSGAPSSSTLGGVSSDAGEAASKCAGNFFDEATCGREFQRAWGWSVLINWPYKNEYDMAVQAETNAGKSAGVIQTLLRVEQKFDNLCAAEDPSKFKIIETGRKTTSGYPEAYRIRNVIGDNDKANQRGKLGTIVGDLFDPLIDQVAVDYGEYIKASTTEVKQNAGGKLTEINKIDEGVYFNPLQENLAFDKDRNCLNEACKNAAGQPGYKVPASVVNAAALRYSKDYVYNPTAGIFAASKAVCIPAVAGYLTNYRNILNQVSSCFKSITETGKGSSATCNALLSNVVCDFVIDAIRCGGRLSTNALKSPGQGSSVENWLNPFAPIAAAGQSMSESITNRYGETATYNTLFNENALMHSVCIGALTGDWDIEGVSDLLTQATIVPVDSTCVAFPANRRFVTSNPITGQASYLYYAGGMLAAGSDITSLSVQLVCSNDNSCNRYGAESNPNGECDCFGLPNEKTLQVNTDKYSLKQGEVYDDAKYIPISDADIRYDKLRIRYTYKDNMQKDVTKDCVTQLKEDGSIPATCRYVPLLGFRCEAAIGDRGTARFVEAPSAKIENEGIYYTGDPYTIHTRIEVVSPKGKEIPKYARFVVRNKNGYEIERAYDLKLDQGVKDYDVTMFTIKESDFVRNPIDPIEIANSVHSNGATVIDNSKIISDVTFGSTSFIVTFPTIDATAKTGTYVCNDVGSDSAGRRTINKRTGESPKQFSETASISCNGVSFRLSGVDKLSQEPADISKTTPYDTYSGSAFFVKYTKPSSDQECSSSPTDWTTEVTLYHAEQSNPLNLASEDTSDYVISKSPIATKDVTTKVVCKKFAEETAAPYNIREFTVPSSAKKGDTIKINWIIEAPGISIKSLKLSISGTDINLQPALSGNDVPIVLTSDIAIGKAQASLKINDVVDKTTVRNIEIKS